jgi:hypothetical protein
MDGRTRIEGVVANGSAVVDPTPNGLRIYLRHCKSQDSGIDLVFLTRME